mmetsp:Transcript_19167/g.47891  ORF Transcript_19167/g.47891 Transcript_19167/m.47891 type:complete len:277 (-) Transcript_19167:191-1021(-)
MRSDSASVRSDACSSAWTMPWKYGDSAARMGSSSSSPQQHVASFCRLQHALPATCGLSTSASTSTLRISLRLPAETTAVVPGDTWPTNSKMRPMVHAVVSFTCALASFMALSRNGSAWDATGASLSGSGPSRMEPNAKVAASRLRHSVLEMLAWMYGMTWSTTGSCTHVATSPRQVPPAMARFHASSPSSSWSSSCLVRHSSSMGTSMGSACSMKRWYTTVVASSPSSSSSSWRSTSSSHTADQNSMACSATASSSLLVAFTVRSKMAVMYGCSLS